MMVKTPLNQEDVIKIKKVLTKFQAGYTKRNVEVLDDFIGEVFVQNERMITVGTSRSEWCFGRNELKELLKSDWMYWGNLTVNIENAKINTKGNSAWFLADSTISWDTTEDAEEWRQDLVDDFFKKNGRFVHFSPAARVAMLNEKLLFIMKSFAHKQKEPLTFPIRLSGGLVRQDQSFRINRLHFSVPMKSFPEWRIDKNNPDSLKYYNQIKKRMLHYNELFDDECREEITELLHNLRAHYLGKTNPTQLIKKLFSSYDDNYVVDPNENPAAIGNNHIEKILILQRQKWDEFVLNIEEALIHTEGDTASIITSGIFRKSFLSNEFLQKELHGMKETLQKEGKGEGQLFKAQKQIAHTIKELSFGEEALWEFRFEATAIKEKGKWKFHNLQFTYPSLHLFEGNYRMIPLLSTDQ
ncbi:hypothetical protein WAK64_14860 [Bacillus spongiae]|uniref:SnoaL-like domain-containing protein n=1 Tax=Bacillus spongiae TaxID=2683610 RepID=A0ABU8HGP9_9BACI